MFLHKSHVFSNISKILSKSEEWSDANVNDANNIQASRLFTASRAIMDAAWSSKRHLI